MARSYEMSITTTSRLAAIAALQGGVERRRDQLVVQARREGMSWAGIGELLGVSAQGLHRRFREAVDDA